MKIDQAEAVEEAGGREQPVEKGCGGPYIGQPDIEGGSGGNY